MNILYDADKYPTCDFRYNGSVYKALCMQQIQFLNNGSNKSENKKILLLEEVS